MYSPFYPNYNNAPRFIPPSINYPAFNTQTVNLAALAPAIVVTGPGFYSRPFANYPRFTPLIYGGPLYGSSLLNFGDATMAAAPTMPMGQLVYNPALNQVNGTLYPLAAGVDYPLVTVSLAPTQMQSYLSPEFTETGNTTDYYLTNASANYVSKSGGSETRRTPSNRRSTAYIDVRVPANAELWFEGVKTRQKGQLRRFVSPPLTPGRRFTYNLRATWKVNGKKVTERRRIVVRAGDWVSLDWAAPNQAKFGALTAK
jgi:uncharacterized protein (TIGR03000 family)